MASDDHSGTRPAGPVVLRIKLRYDDLDAMVQRFAPNVGKSGLFLPTKSIQPIGTEVKFELRLANDTPVLVGMGKVKHVRPPDPKQPRAAFGMAIELMRVSREGREVIIRMIERRRAMGLPDVAIPVPEDIDAARRSEVDSQPRAETSGIVRDAMSQFASAPVGEQVLTGSPTQTGPIGTVKDPTLTGPIVIAKGTLSEPVATAKGTLTDAVPIMPTSESTSAPAASEPSSPAERPSSPAERPSSPAMAQERPSSSLMTAPRASRSTAEHKAVATLPPEPARTRRPRVADLIAKATELSGPLAAAPIPELDEQVDVQRALARARALAAGDLDAELSAVRELAAAPIEIGIEAASAELARQLGGKAIVKRDRSAGWAPPPAVETRHEVPSESAMATPTAVASESSVPTAVESAVPPGDAPADDPAFAAKTRAETEIAPSAVIATVTAAAVENAPADHPPASDVAAPEEPLLVEGGPLSMRAPSSEPVDEDNVLESAPVDRISASSLESAESVEPEAADRSAHQRDGYERDASQPGVEMAAVIAARAAAADDDDDEPMELDDADLEPEDDDAQAAAAAEYEQDQHTRVPSGDEAPALYARAARQLDQTPIPTGDEDAAAEFDRDLRTRVPSGDDDALREFDRDLRTRVPSGDEQVRAPSPMAGMMISDDADVSEFERALDDAPEHLNSNEIELADEPAESTQIGEAPLPPGPAHGYPTTPDALADSLDQQLADAEAEAEAELAIGMQESQLDAYGRPVAYDANGQPIEYDANGRRIVYDENGQPLAGFDANGQPVGYDENGEPSQRIAYDANGNPIVYDANGTPVAYDANGNPIADDANGNPVVYDANGNPIVFDANGNPVAYDASGNPVAYDANGNPIAYDANGNPVAYDTNGNPIAYDANGQPIGYEQGGYDPNAYAQGEYAQGQGYDDGAYAQPAAAADAEDGEEISDFDVLAVADEEDADLMSASAESDSRDRAPAYADPSFETPPYDKAEPDDALAPQDRPSFDFASALDLGEEEAPLAREVHERSHAPMRPKRSSSAGDFDAPSNSYTFAENPPSVNFALPNPSFDEALGNALDDDGEHEFDEPHGYSAPAQQRHAPAQPVAEPKMLRTTAQNPDDLEDALAALDVDLDDISLDDQRSRRASAPSTRASSTGSRPLPGLPIHRPSEHSRPIAHTVPRTPTGQQQAIKPPTGQQPVSHPPSARDLEDPPSTQYTMRRPKSGQDTVLPKKPIQAPGAPKRAATDDGILIDFDDDE